MSLNDTGERHQQFIIKVRGLNVTRLMFKFRGTPGLNFRHAPAKKLNRCESFRKKP